MDPNVDATINGRFDFDLTDSAAQVATQTAGSAISGGVHQIDLSGVVKDARNASATAAALLTSSGSDVLTLSGMTMILNGVAADNILWNLTGLGGDVSITSGSVVFGTFLAPERDLVSDHGIVGGRIIAGGSGSLLNIHSGSQITTPSTVPDGGSTLALLGVALVGLAKLKRKLAE